MLERKTRAIKSFLRKQWITRPTSPRDVFPRLVQKTCLFCFKFLFFKFQGSSLVSDCNSPSLTYSLTFRYKSLGKSCSTKQGPNDVTNGGKFYAHVIQVNSFAPSVLKTETNFHPECKSSKRKLFKSFNLNI